jgi:hypothetical protein
VDDEVRPPDDVAPRAGLRQIAHDGLGAERACLRRARRAARQDLDRRPRRREPDQLADDVRADVPRTADDEGVPGCHATMGTVSPGAIGPEVSAVDIWSVALTAQGEILIASFSGGWYAGPEAVAYGSGDADRRP